MSDRTTAQLINALRLIAGGNSEIGWEAANRLRDLEVRIAELETQGEEARACWYRSRHYQRLRQYRQRLTVAEDSKAELLRMLEDREGESANMLKEIDYLRNRVIMAYNYVEGP